MSEDRLDILLAEARAIRAGVEAIDGRRPVDRPAMERRITALCERAVNLPPAEAKQLAEDLAGIVAALDAASDRIAEVRRTAESADRAHAGRRAAAAYGRRPGGGGRVR